MKLSFEYKGTKIEYNLMYKKIAMITININEKGEVKVTAPLGTSVQTVMDKVKGHATWIIQELDKIHSKTNNNEIRAQYTYLDKNYAVEMIKNTEADDTTVKLIRGKFVIETPTDNKRHIKQALVAWYQDKVATKAKERLKIYTNYFDTLPLQILAHHTDEFLVQLKEDTLFINPVVAVMPIYVIDYILVKVLCSSNYSNQEQRDEKLKEVLVAPEESVEWLEKNKTRLFL